MFSLQVRTVPVSVWVGGAASIRTADAALYQLIAFVCFIDSSTTLHLRQILSLSCLSLAQHVDDHSCVFASSCSRTLVVLNLFAMYNLAKPSSGWEAQRSAVSTKLEEPASSAFTNSSSNNRRRFLLGDDTAKFMPFIDDDDFMNGATSSLTNELIRSLFDRIFPLSPLERFKNTPLRHMSSGHIGGIPTGGVVRNIPIKVERVSDFGIRFCFTAFSPDKKKRQPY
ncbi:unnamed protein product [Gongylonema pulchrum]|uniref:Secreted protein n=1 Tax=Gongylonema pulchrum TaxID=637853 RepID=A0A183DYU0_9BILA|nr:unnamed protein product [Gongylonema pulchrum]